MCSTIDADQAFYILDEVINVFKKIKEYNIIHMDIKIRYLF